MNDEETMVGRFLSLLFVAVVVAGSADAACIAVDGDTLNCGGTRVRLLGIDAPELPGHCRRGRTCAAGDPYASKRSLAAALHGGVRIEPITTDRYGRVVAVVWVDGQSASCLQLAAGQAQYVGRWDNGHRIAQECPTMTYRR